MPEGQSFKNHIRFDPLFHCISAPILLINFFVWIGISVVHHRHHLPLHLWLVAVSFALLVLAANGRGNDLKVQDRVIRLEERLRYTALLPAAELAASASLTVKQIVALRFASDAELPGLVARAIAEDLTPKQIKAGIVDWRADYHRV